MFTLQDCAVSVKIQVSHDVWGLLECEKFGIALRIVNSYESYLRRLSCSHSSSEEKLYVDYILGLFDSLAHALNCMSLESCDSILREMQGANPKTAEEKTIDWPEEVITVYKKIKDEVELQITQLRFGLAKKNLDIYISELQSSIESFEKNVSRKEVTTFISILVQLRHSLDYEKVDESLAIVTALDLLYIHEPSS